MRTCGSSFHEAATDPGGVLAAVGVTYLLVFVAYGHAGLPLAVALPVVWGNWQSADRAMASVALAGALGVGALLGSMLLNSDAAPWRRCAAGGALSCAVSVAIAVVISELGLVTAMSSLPFAIAIGGFARSLASRGVVGR